MKEDLDVLLKWKSMHQLQTGECKVSTIDAEKIMQMVLRGYSSGLKCVGHVSFTGVSLNSQPLFGSCPGSMAHSRKDV